MVSKMKKNYAKKILSILLFITLSGISVFAQTNLALNQPTSASSTNAGNN